MHLSHAVPKLYFNCLFYLIRMIYTGHYSGQGLPSIIACGVSDRPASVAMWQHRNCYWPMRCVVSGSLGIPGIKFCNSRIPRNEKMGRGMDTLHTINRRSVWFKAILLPFKDLHFDYYLYFQFIVGSCTCSMDYSVYYCTKCCYIVWQLSSYSTALYWV